MNAALLAAALVVGCLLAVQASVNLQLNKAVGTPYGASTVQLGVATGLLVVLAAVTGSLGALGKTPTSSGGICWAAWPAPSTSPAASCSSPGWEPWPRSGCSSRGRCSPHWSSTWAASSGWRRRT